MSIRQTSKDVYAEIKESGLMSHMRWLVYDQLYWGGPMTAQEVFKSLGCDTNQSGRFTEMREMGAIEEVGIRACTITGNDVIEWAVSGNMPMPVVRGRVTRPSTVEIAVATDYIKRTVVDACANGTAKPVPDELVRLMQWLDARPMKRNGKEQLVPKREQPDWASSTLKRFILRCLWAVQANAGRNV